MRCNGYRKGVRARNGKGFVKVEGGVIGWLGGGEPVLGCEGIQCLIFAPTRAEVKIRARKIGLSGAYVMDWGDDPDAAEIAAVLADPEGFVWCNGEDGIWRPSATLAR